MAKRLTETEREKHFQTIREIFTEIAKINNKIALAVLGSLGTIESVEEGQNVPDSNLTRLRWLLTVILVNSEGTEDGKERKRTFTAAVIALIKDGVNVTAIIELFAPFVAERDTTT